IADAAARERFLARGGVGPASSPAAASALRDGGGQTPSSFGRAAAQLAAADVDRATGALVRSLGPIAKMVTRRCAEGAPARDEFVARVLKQVGSDVDLRRLESDLWRVLG